MSRNKELKHQRMRGYFIEATNLIIQSDGIEGITTRRVAEQAGYNVSTLYNYFDNVDHLIALSLTSHIGVYIEAIIKRLKGVTDPYKLYQGLWLEFVEHAFREPVVYYYMFFKNTDRDVSEVFEAYFSEYPDKLKLLDSSLQVMFFEKHIYLRDMRFLETSFPNHDKLELERISDINIMVYRSMLQDLQGITNEKEQNKYIKKYETYFSFLTQSLQA